MAKFGILVKVKFKHNWTDNFQMGPIEEGLIKIITGCFGSRLGQVALAIRHVKMICLVVLWIVFSQFTP